MGLKRGVGKGRGMEGGRYECGRLERGITMREGKRWAKGRGDIRKRGS